MATYNLGRVGIVARGAYSAGTTYEALDMVSYQGSGYIAKGTTNSVPSNTSYWMQAAQGAYAAAVLSGYSGTESQFGADLAAMQSLASELMAL